MRVALAALLIPLSCMQADGPEYGWRPLEGARHETPKHKLVFYWTGPGGIHATPESAAAQIDVLLDEWHQLYEARWGYNLNRWQRRDHLRLFSIQLFQGERVRGNNPDGDTHTFGIYWPWQRQIDAALAAPRHWDSGMNVWSSGLQVLRHEWSHVFQGAYHP